MNKVSLYIRCLYRSFPLALASLLLFCVFYATPALAAPAINLNVSSGPVGTQIIVTGTVFQSFEGDSIRIIFDTVEITDPITIPAGGTFSVTCTIPADAAAGVHTLSVKGETISSTFIAKADFTVDPRILSLNIDTGHTGTALEISGSGFYINEAVAINYFNPAAGPIGTVTASSAGIFSLAYTIPEGIAGDHRFTAANARGNTAEAVFKIIPEVILNVDSGAPGEFVLVRGTGFSANSAISVYLDTLMVAAVQTDAYGSMETEFIIPAVTLSTHYLKVQDSLGLKAENNFPVTAGVILSGNNGAAGSPVTLSGDGFISGSTISITFDDQPVTSAAADNNGRFSASFTVPTGSSGEHTIKVTDGFTTRQYSYYIETAPPPVPAPLSPARDTLTSAFTALNWQPVTDPSLPVTYHLQIAADKSFTAIVLEKQALTGTGYILAGSEALTAEVPVSVYYWRVMSVDGAGNRSDWSEVWSFIIGVPPSPTLISPLEAIKVEFPIGLNWGQVTSLSGTVVYQLQVSRNEGFSELLIDESNLTSPSFTINLESRRIFDRTTPYYWRVRAVDNAQNTGDWSAAGSFDIATAGFPAWAIYILVALGAALAALIIFRIRRRKTYH